MLKNMTTMWNFVVLCLFSWFEAYESGLANLKFPSLRNVKCIENQKSAHVASP